MACACQSGNAGTPAPTSYTATLPGNIQKSYASKIEAEAAVARAGGGTVRPKA